MARLNSDGNAERGSRREGTGADRGQMFLVVAVAIAVLLVGLTVILNAAMFAGNLATRDDGVDDASALAYRNSVVEEGAILVEHTNRYNNSTYGELRSSIRARVTTWSDLAGRQAAADGSGAHTTVVGTSNGTLVDQLNASRPFTNAAGSPSWELVPDASNVRAAYLNVSREALVDPGGNDSTSSDLVNESVFALTLDNGSDVWRVFVHQNGVEVVVKVEDPSGNLSSACTAPASADGYVRVDLSNASVGDRACPQLDILGDITGSFDIRFERGRSVAGTYSLVAEQKISAVDDGDFAPTGSGDWPRASYALYSTTLEVTYVTPTLRYETTVRIAPGESDD